MCQLCEKAKAGGKYRSLLERMGASDSARLEHSRQLSPDFTAFPILAYSTIEYPKLLVQPMFEPKMAFSTPVNYFQNLFLNREKLPGNFSHGATRSLFFIGERLMLFSKSTAVHEGEEFFSSFLLAHLEKSEYALEIGPGGISISADLEKTARNLLTGKTEKISISFSFGQGNLEGKILSKDSALRSTLFTDQFKRIGVNPRSWLTSTDYMFDYVISVPHFSPHPYMLQLASEFGYASQKEFQERAPLEYFAAHGKK